MTRASKDDQNKKRSLRFGRVFVHLGGISLNNKRLKSAKKQAAMIRSITSLSRGRFVKQFVANNAKNRLTERQKAFVLLNLLRITNPSVFREFIKQLKNYPEKGTPANITYKQAAVHVDIMSTKLKTKNNLHSNKQGVLKQVTRLE